MPDHTSIDGLVFLHFFGKPAAQAVADHSFNIFASSTVSWRDHLVTAHIIGASHRITIIGRTLNMAEVLSCAGTPGIQKKPSNRIEGARRARWSVNACKHQITTNIWTSRLHSGSKGEHTTATGNEDIPIKIRHEFEGEDNPATGVQITTNEKRLIIETWHEYPNGSELLPVASTLTIITPR
jgi:hypothetical protein